MCCKTLEKWITNKGIRNRKEYFLYEKFCNSSIERDFLIAKKNKWKNWFVNFFID